MMGCGFARLDRENIHSKSKINFSKMKTTAVIILSISFLVLSLNSTGQALSKDEFKEPSIENWPRPLWFWNNATVTREGIEEQMQAYKDLCGYGGFGILPFGKNFKPEYLTEDYFLVYGKALEKAKELGLTMCLYDEYGFPSGGIGLHGGDAIPRFELQFPEQTIKRLDKIEDTISGPAVYDIKIPPAIRLMSAVAMKTNTLERIDLTKHVSGESLKWNIPEGDWRIMIFMCVKDPDYIVDYLDPDAVKNFIKMTHDEYYKRFQEYFGTVINGTFFDEPTMYRAKGRMWTEKFNEKFETKYGFSPAVLYPALWYNIGPETEYARNLLFGFRAELYAEGFTKEVNDWSVEHGVWATGHQDQEEVLNQVSISGDFMKSFKYLEVPGIDKIGGNRPAENFYKLTSSSAYNWDRNLVMSETYGAMGTFGNEKDLTWNQIFSIAMDQYAKGINMLIPHAVWYDVNHVTYKPELSHRNPLYADSLKVFNQFLSRLNYVLQKEARHVADIAILYPIHTMQGDHFLDGPLGHYKGGVDIPHTDYVDVSNWLTNYAGKDFTFIHPEVLDEKCSVTDGVIHLQNKINWGEYRIVVVPSCKTISVSNLQKIKEFYESGGAVIFTTRLPSIAVEKGKNEEVVNLIRSIFPNNESSQGIIYTSNKGGKALFISKPSAISLRMSLTEICSDFDVEYTVNEDIRYIHKVIDGQDVFYFANTGSGSVDLPVTLRGNFKLQSWDPHTGNIRDLESENNINNKNRIKQTYVTLSLKPYRSTFLVGRNIKQ
jgi:hypothetical protein